MDVREEMEVMVVLAAQLEALEELEVQDIQQLSSHLLVQAVREGKEDVLVLWEERQEQEE